MEIENRIQARKELLLRSQSLPVATNELSTLGQLKKQLANLETTYTKRHPDVIRLRAKIAKIESENGEDDSDTSLIDTFDSESVLLGDPTLQELLRQSSEIRLTTKDLANDIVRLKRQINTYQQRVEQTPKREEELLALNRDYQNIQNSYNSLLNRKLEADIALNMEKKQKGEQFRIIDRASVSRRPETPDLRKLFLMVIAVGFGIGGGTIFLLDFFDSSLKSPEEFESDLGISVLATIPKVYLQKDIRIKKLHQILTFFFLGVAVCLTAGFAMLVFNGVENTMEMVRPYLATLML
jgi:uncharacterized protein involved in exopolysaccharide biosynthesis